MEEPLNLTLPPQSLRSLSITRTAIHLINLAIKTDIKDSTIGIWLLNECESTISDKLSALSLPIDWKESLESLIDEICAKINFWCKWLERIWGRIPGPLLKHIYKHININDLGCVNQIKSAQNIIADESFATVFRFTLACMYCLEPSIYDLGSQVTLDYVDDYEDRLIRYWRYHLLGHVEKLMENWTLVKSRLLEYSIAFGNKWAAEFFFNKCSESEREIAFNLFDLKDRAPTSIFLFFNLLNGSQLKNVLRKYGCLPLFDCLSYRPEISVLVRTYQRLMSYIDEKTFLEILLSLSRSSLVTAIDGDQKAWVFDLIWNEAPVSHKNYVLDGSGIVKLTDALHEFKHYRNLWNLFKYQSPAQRQLLCRGLVNLCELTRHWYFEKRGFEKSHLNVIKIHSAKVIKSTDDFYHLSDISTWYFRVEEWKQFMESLESQFSRNQGVKRKVSSTNKDENESKRVLSNDVVKF